MEAAVNVPEGIRVLIADDHRLFGEALEAILATDDRLEVVGHAGYGSEAVQLRYEDARQRLFTVFLRPSAGPDAFEVTERGPVRICVWQNADLTAVMTGEMSTPELFRLASLTYSSLGL